MTKLKLKRVYDDYSPDDGYRVLVDKLWPRGVKKESLKFDEWNKVITPSTTLRKWYHDDMKNRWNEFKTYYLRELNESQAVSAFIDSIKQYPEVTLLYASKDKEQNHALILKSYIDEVLKGE